ncbi:MAG: pyruvate dehydrogenase (acetyl-transferring), homodimeric type [candidate division Zixibacteria bacterium]|nr:pyruvate dehydrogenase (acetyl-transferring), homodimeric type [candidate division Zixibacteria bacterium]
MSSEETSGAENLETDVEESVELQEWLESLDYVLAQKNPDRVQRLLQALQYRAARAGIPLPFSATTPYVNTIPANSQTPYPGDRELERRIKNYIRWNALAMVVRANWEDSSIGGHISTYASSATLYEVGFNHFFRARNGHHEGDLLFVQGHGSPGIYARAFLEGRITEEHLQNFRREVKPPGLSSYPHPWLMPDFWEFPTVSMGLGSIMAIYQARFMRYLENRGIKTPSDSKVWVMMGDGETDEPESLGAITVATREKLDNLIFVINCNLQRLDGPVRGNGKIIQELEGVFRGAGWNVIKVIWGTDWDALLEKDDQGRLVRRMNETVDGQYQKYSVESGEYIRKNFFGDDPALAKIVEDLSDEQLERLRRGGHDPEKVYHAYRAAADHKGSPTVILVKTIKGYGLGESGQGANSAHQKKKMTRDELIQFRDRFKIPISNEEISKAPFYRPSDQSAEIVYLRERRKKLGGYVPARRTVFSRIGVPGQNKFEEFYKGTGEREVSTTMAFVGILAKLMRDKEIGKMIVPIVPDEARTFGMDALFRQSGIYSPVGQLYEPVDAQTLLYYRESKDGQLLEEGISEAGAMASFIAAGTAYSTYDIPTIPFYIYYSMFGLQRIGDLVWAAGDMRCRGFLVGATSGRTTLAGEGLQHQDGHSHLLAYPVPNLLAYDPAYAYELAVIVEEGLRRMYEKQESVFYYLTVHNENYAMPAMPGNVEVTKDGIMKGMYLFRKSSKSGTRLHAQLLGSGAILNETLKAAEMLEKTYEVATDVWSVTSYKALQTDAEDVERWNMLHPTETPRISYVAACTQDAPGVFVAASDYVKALPDSISSWFPRPLISLGTDGFGRSDNRAALREFFEVDARYITLATLYGLAREGSLAYETVKKALRTMKIDPNKPNPLTV